jgi:enolase-phosphatase E1
MTKLFLFDIEGTTTDINFVHKVLFPYSREHLTQFILQHYQENSIAKAVNEVKETVLKEEGKVINIEGVIETLHRWIKEDRKHGALKEIQGHIWDVGYSRNDFKGHVYPDVKPCFYKILETGSKIGIYSSGSVHAQKLIFGFSTEGDLTPFISYYFDTSVGGKRDSSSYKKISEMVSLSPSEIHFFSDIPEELAAAKNAGFDVTHVLRPGTEASNFKSIHDFSEMLTNQ